MCNKDIVNLKEISKSSLKADISKPSRRGENYDRKEYFCTFNLKFIGLVST